MYGRAGARPYCTALLRLFLFLLHFDNFTTFIETAVGTNGVRKAHGTAVGTGGQVARLQSVMRSAIIAAAL